MSERRRLDARKVAAVRLWAADRMPYLASAVFATQFVAAEGSRPIAAAERWRVRADPAVLEQLDVPGAGALYLHLIGHLLREHASRATARSQQYGDAPFDPARWNRCSDAEINDDLGEFVPKVAPDLPQSMGCEPGRLAEHYYDRALDGPRVEPRVLQPVELALEVDPLLLEQQFHDADELARASVARRVVEEVAVAG